MDLLTYWSCAALPAKSLIVVWLCKRKETAMLMGVFLRNLGSKRANKGEIAFQGAGWQSSHCGMIYGFLVGGSLISWPLASIDARTTQSRGLLLMYVHRYGCPVILNLPTVSLAQLTSLRQKAVNFASARERRWSVAIDRPILYSWNCQML